jgi:hypothetical protein
MIENTFLLALALAAFAGALSLGFIGTWLVLRIFKGKERAAQFWREEF